MGLVWGCLGRRVIVVLAGGAIVITLGVGGLFVALAMHPAPARLALGNNSPAATAPPTPTVSPSVEQERACARPSSAAEGTYWAVQAGSQAGYRARETFGVLTTPHEAVARTDAVQGYLLIDQSASSGPLLRDGCIAADMRTLTSVDTLPAGFPDATGRDQHYPQLLDTANHPYVVFRPDSTQLPGNLASGATVSVRFVGELNIRGSSRSVAARADARVINGHAQLAGSLLIHAPDFGVEVPLEQVVSPDITLEFLLQLAPV